MRLALAAILVCAALPPQSVELPKIRIRVAGAQIAVTADVQKNLETILRAIDYAVEQKADILVTPEGSLSGYFEKFDSVATAKALEVVVKKAREAHLALALGTCFQEEDGRRYDQLRFYDREGTFLGFHAKILLCRRVSDPSAKGEIDYFKSAPLRKFSLGALPVGGLVCNDMWANPEWTPMDDPHLAQQLSKLGARVIFHSVNAGTAEGDDLALNRQYHEANLKLRARGGKIWIVTVDACDPQGKKSSNAPSGVLSPQGKWVVQTEPRGEQFFAHTLEIEP